MTEPYFLDDKRIRIFNPELAIKGQKEYWDKSGNPDFAPHDGRCWNCRSQIYAEGGIDVEQASNTLVTGCPFCHRSYCD